MDTKLHIGNLPYSISEDELRELFGQAGNISSVVIIKDRYSGKSKGFGFVEMSSQTDAEEAIQRFNGSEVGGREIKVSIARPREDKGDRRGGGRRFDQGQGGSGPRRSGGQRDRGRSGGWDRNRRDENKD